MVAIPQPQDEQLDEQPEKMTEAEYLAFEDESEFKHEYSRGRVYAMTGGTVRHGALTVSVSTHLSNLLADRDCTVTSPDVRVHVGSESAYRYPDVTVFCGEPAYMQGRNDTITNPILLVEVLSPSSAVTDHNDKLREYTAIDSLYAYLLVSQNEAVVQRYLRHDSGNWLYTVFEGLEAEIALPELDLTLSLSSIYRKVTFDEPEADDEGQ